jgi:hypothetical protein
MISLGMVGAGVRKRAVDLLLSKVVIRGLGNMAE